MYNNSYFVPNSQYEYNHMQQFYASSSNALPQFYGQQMSSITDYGMNEHIINKQHFYESALNQRKNNAQFITNFINENCDLSKLKNDENKPKLGISEAKTLMASIESLNNELKTLTASMKSEIDESSESDWREKMDRCRQLQSEIEELAVVLRSNKNVLSFKKMLEKRRKKRIREKKVADKWKLTKKAVAENRLRLHAKIDAWISEKQNEIEREKQETDFLKDADMILADIRGKRSDSKKYLALLSELQSLRKVKTSNASARGEKVSAAADQSFENIITQLLEQWSTLDREYATEEQGLKLMLKKDNEKNREKQKKHNFDEWEVAIFGRKISPHIKHKNINNLVMTRFLWDRYINCQHGTRIPIGWVMPSPVTPSTPWQGCLKQRK